MAGIMEQYHLLPKDVPESLLELPCHQVVHDQLDHMHDHRWEGWKERGLPLQKDV